jgi:hypothetical protein
MRVIVGISISVILMLSSCGDDGTSADGSVGVSTAVAAATPASSLLASPLITPPITAGAARTSLSAVPVVEATNAPTTSTPVIPLELLCANAQAAQTPSTFPPSTSQLPSMVQSAADATKALVEADLESVKLRRSASGFSNDEVLLQRAVDETAVRLGRGDTANSFGLIVTDEEAKVVAAWVEAQTQVPKVREVVSRYPDALTSVDVSTVIPDLRIEVQYFAYDAAAMKAMARVSKPFGMTACFTQVDYSQREVDDAIKALKREIGRGTVQKPLGPPGVLAALTRMGHRAYDVLVPSSLDRAQIQVDSTFTKIDSAALRAALLKGTTGDERALINALDFDIVAPPVNATPTTKA